MSQAKAGAVDPGREQTKDERGHPVWTTSVPSSVVNTLEIPPYQFLRRRVFKGRCSCKTFSTTLRPTRF